MIRHLTLNPQIIRTLSIIRQLALGKILRLNATSTIAMSGNFTIGLLVENLDTRKLYVSPMSDLSFRDLNELCERYEIGPIIPEKKI